MPYYVYKIQPLIKVLEKVQVRDPQPLTGEDY